MAWPGVEPKDFIAIQLGGTFLASGQQWRNTFHFWCHDTADSPSAAELKDMLDSAWMSDLVTAYQGLMSGDGTIDGVLARGISDPADPSYIPPEAFKAFSSVGVLGGGTDAPTAISPLLKINTDSAQRSAHGHVFLPYRGTLSTDSNNNNWDTAASFWTSSLAGIVTQLNKVLYTAGGGHASGAVTDIDLVVYSRARHILAETPFAFRATAVTRSPKVRYLRSRQP